jgi:hypothetical protein
MALFAHKGVDKRDQGELREAMGPAQSGVHQSNALKVRQLDLGLGILKLLPAHRSDAWVNIES